MNEHSIIDANIAPDDIDNYSLRPLKLKEFIGQKKLTKNLSIFVEACKARNDFLDHVLLYGPPGLGKTTLAQIVAKELGVSFRSTSGPVISKTGDLAAILTNLEEGDVLFIDEIHRLNTTIEEILYSAMEDYKLDIIIGEGPAARTLKIDLPKFTLIGATTRIGLLTNPLRDRFGINLRIEFYQANELSLIIERAAKLLNLNILTEAVMEIAKRSRGTPRIALRLLKRVRDFFSVSGNNSIDAKLARKALELLEIDQAGLDSNDIRYLTYIANHYDGGPVGVETICAGLSEQRDTVEETIEPYLLQIGFIQRSPRGRIVTPSAFAHLKLPLPKHEEKD